MRLLAPGLFLALSLIGCTPAEITFEDGDLTLTEALVGHVYDAILTVPSGASEPVTWSLDEGNLPEGVTFSSDGFLTGTPWELGTFPLTLSVTDANGKDASATTALKVSYVEGEVIAGLVDEAPNNMCLDAGGGDKGGLMCGPWVRVAGAGATGQESRVLVPVLWWWGEDGEHSHGPGSQINEEEEGSDDVMVGTLDSASLTWSFEPLVGGTSHGSTTVSPTDTTVVEGVLQAGEETGPGEILIGWEGGESRVYSNVVPPDWCEPAC